MGMNQPRPPAHQPLWHTWAADAPAGVPGPRPQSLPIQSIKEAIPWRGECGSRQMAGRMGSGEDLGLEDAGAVGNTLKRVWIDP